MVGSHAWHSHTDSGILKWLIETRNPKSFLDVGCGVMGMVNMALSMGLDARGIDGDERLVTRRWPGAVADKLTIHLDRLITARFDESVVVVNQNYYDIIWSIEVAEHVDPNRVDYFLGTINSNLSQDGVIVFTHSLGPSGGQHLNCQPAEYWIKQFSRFGIVRDDQLTEKAHEVSTMLTESTKREFFQNTGMILRRTA